MRQAGTLAFERDARRLTDYLLTLGIASRAEPDGERWAVWIVDEKQLERGKLELAQFVAAPDDPKYQAAEHAREIRRQSEAEARRSRQRTVELRDRWQGGSGRPQLSIALILVSVLAAITTDLGKKIESETCRALFISAAWLPDPETGLIHVMPAIGPAQTWNEPDFGLTEIAHGEVWRLITPIFLHFSPMHLLFNMLALLQMGGAIESRQGPLRLGLIALVSAVTSNLTQYFWSGPMFGGMSGVVFALFGYLWMQSKFVPASGLYMPRQTVFLAMVWLVACSVADAHIANAAHFGGFAVGVAMGLAPRFLR